MASSPPATTTKNSIAESVHALQQQTARFKEQLAIIQKDGKGNEADLHGLGPVNLSECRRQFAHEIDTIRSICSQFETQVLNDVIKMGAGADPAFRKHFTHLKEQAAHESTVRRVTSTLTKTKEQLEQMLNEREPSPAKRQTHLLEKLAQQAGLVAFVDHESHPDTTTITLGGTVIVIDVSIWTACNAPPPPLCRATEQNFRLTLITMAMCYAQKRRTSLKCCKATTMTASIIC